MPLLGTGGRGPLPGVSHNGNKESPEGGRDAEEGTVAKLGYEQLWSWASAASMARFACLSCVGCTGRRPRIQTGMIFRLHPQDPCARLQQPAGLIALCRCFSRETRMLTRRER